MRSARIVSGLLLVSTAMLAHHGTFASYDRDKTISMKGTVTQFQFSYPHPLIFFDVKDDSGNVVHWAAEMLESPAMLKSKDANWTRDLLKPNDRITIVCNPHKVPDAKVCRTQELTVNDKKVY